MGTKGVRVCLQAQGIKSDGSELSKGLIANARQIVSLMSDEEFVRVSSLINKMSDNPSVASISNLVSMLFMIGLNPDNNSIDVKAICTVTLTIRDNNYVKAEVSMTMEYENG